MQSARMLMLRLYPETRDQDAIAHTYRVAGQILVADRQLTDLAFFSTPAFAGSVPTASGMSPGRNLPGCLIYHGQSFIGSVWREVQCHRDLGGYRLSVTGVGSFSIDSQGTIIDLLAAAPDTSANTLSEVVLGPVLILALALRGTWCLHASAVKVQERAIVFVGESGQGKSTLAAFLGSGCDNGWERLVDDILPVTLTSNGLDALPQFPQLKLPSASQISVMQPERLPVAAIYVIAPPTPKRETCEIQSLTARDAALVLVRHTIAARLFDRQLLTQHLATCSGAAAHIPIRRLTYPHQHNMLPHVCNMLAADLRSMLILDEQDR